jgi:hypothetical protein
MNEQKLRSLLEAELGALGRAAVSLDKSLSKCSRRTLSPDKVSRRRKVSMR